MPLASTLEIPVGGGKIFPKDNLGAAPGLVSSGAASHPMASPATAAASARTRFSAISTAAARRPEAGSPLRIRGAADTEPFPSCLCVADLEYADGLGELPGAPGAAADAGSHKLIMTG
jgi:hypothetical protein